MGGFGIPELLIVLVIVLVLFGAKRGPMLIKNTGKALKDFRKAMKDDKDG